MVADGASTAAGRRGTARPVSHATKPPAVAHGTREATGTCNAVDDHSRVAYSEILDDERKETAAGFWTRANAFFAGIGVTVAAVMTDNGSCYRSHAFADALGETIKHKGTTPDRPQTNGKVERFNRTVATEWAYAVTYATEDERAAAYDAWLHHYIHHRSHTGIGGQVPSARVHNLTGKYI